MKTLFTLFTLFTLVMQQTFDERNREIRLNINGHLHSKDSILAARATGSPTIVPMHFGAFHYLQGPDPQSLRDRDEMERELGSGLTVLELGASLPLPAE